MTRLIALALLSSCSLFTMPRAPGQPCSSDSTPVLVDIALVAASSAAAVFVGTRHERSETWRRDGIDVFASLAGIPAVSAAVGSYWAARCEERR